MQAWAPGRTRTASADVPNSHEAVCLLGTRDAEAPACMATEDWRFGKEALRPWMETHRIHQQSRRALAVDDERGVRGTFSLFQEPGRHGLALVESGECAITPAQRRMPDVVLPDLVMPGISSVETLKALHAMDRDLPVIIVADHPDRAVLLDSIRRALAGLRRRGEETA